MTFDYKKPFTTVDGRKARLLADDLKNEHPLVVAVETPHMKVETVRAYRKDGTSAYASSSDTLVNVLERREFFFNVYDNVETYKSMEDAIEGQVFGGIGVMRIVLVDDKIVEQEYFPNNV